MNRLVAPHRELRCHDNDLQIVSIRQSKIIMGSLNDQAKSSLVGDQRPCAKQWSFYPPINQNDDKSLAGVTVKKQVTSKEVENLNSKL